VSSYECLHCRACKTIHQFKKNRLIFVRAATQALKLPRKTSERSVFLEMSNRPRRAVSRKRAFDEDEEFLDEEEEVPLVAAGGSRAGRRSVKKEVVAGDSDVGSDSEEGSSSDDAEGAGLIAQSVVARKPPGTGRRPAVKVKTPRAPSQRPRAAGQTGRGQGGTAGSLGRGTSTSGGYSASQQLPIAVSLRNRDRAGVVRGRPRRTACHARECVAGSLQQVGLAIDEPTRMIPLFPDLHCGATSRWWAHQFPARIHEGAEGQGE
jgi:hypothetical protein